MMQCTDEQIARVMYAAVTQHYYLNGENYIRLYDTLDSEEQARWIELAAHLRENVNKEGPEATWNRIRQMKITSGVHVERTFDALPDHIQERVFLIRGIVTSLTGWSDERKPPVKVSELRW